MSYCEIPLTRGMTALIDRWRATIMKDREYIHLGTYLSPESAHAAYCAAAKRPYGEFANNGASKT
jgi:hypothetical protein